MKITCTHCKLPIFPTEHFSSDLVFSKELLCTCPHSDKGTIKELNEKVKELNDTITALRNDKNSLADLWLENKDLQDRIKKLEELVENLKDFAYQVCPLDRNDDLYEILNKD